MLNMSGIYCIANTVDGKMYVGSAWNFRKRWNAHRRQLRMGVHHNLHLQRAWDLSGEQAFVFDVLELVESEQLIEREQFWIDFLKSCEEGYNFAPTAGSRAGLKASSETKERMSSARAGKQGPMAGHHHSQETKDEMSRARKGRKKSPEAIEKSAAAHRGMKRSEETKEKMRKASRTRWHKEE